MKKMTFKALLERDSLEDLCREQAFDVIGVLIDHAHDAAAPDLAERALAFADALEARGLSAGELALLDYFRANGWSCLYACRRSNTQAVWSWDQPEIQEQIYFLRRALRGPGFDALPIQRRCEILTNLANQFDTVGRFIEAQEYWTRALALEPFFWMARGNRGRGLMHYANVLYDPGHRAVLARQAHGDLLAALVASDMRPDLGHSSVPPMFSRSAADIGREFDVEAIERSFDPDEPSLASLGEVAYRQWCLDQRLFLNPLNDAMARPIAARDILGLPGFTTALNEPPIVVGLFNGLKQEYVSARWILHCGRNAFEAHPSDREVGLYNTLDYPVYGLRVEQLKLAFRMAYSLFDKIAYFLNHYLALGVPRNAVSFRSIWRDKKTGTLRPLFEESENWAFRGLFWIGKDLFEEGARSVAEPDAEDLATLRNHLEHKYVKVHEMVPPKPILIERRRDPHFDDLAYALSYAELEAKTLRVLKLARSALTCLSLGMHIHERKKAATAAGSDIIVPMLLTLLPDGPE